MSDSIVRDPTTGDGAHVSTAGRISTSAVGRDEIQQRSVEGNVYSLQTSIITLTNTTETPLMYIKNNEPVDIRISIVAWWTSVSTGGASGRTILTAYSNATGGTIISEANDTGVNVNRRIGDSAQILADVYEGGVGKTVTGGVVSGRTISPAGLPLRLPIEIVVARGNTITITAIAPDSNTSMETVLGITAYPIDEDM